MSNFEILKADRRSALFRDFRDIFEALAYLQERFRKKYKLSPFDYTEQAAVGAFVWAAGTRQRLALAEYQVAKSKAPGKKYKRNGRADLWIDFLDQCYSLEFKVASYKATEQNLRKRFEAAKRDAGCVDLDEHDYALGVLVAYVENEGLLPAYDKFAVERDVQLAVGIGKRKAKSCYIYFGTPSED